MAAFGKRKRQAIEVYKQFVVDGKVQPEPWRELKNQIYLGSDSYIDKIQGYLDLDKALGEVPLSQRRPVAKPLKVYQAAGKSRNAAIYEAYQSGGYTLKEIGQYFGLHYSTVSGIIKNHKSKT